MTPVLHYTMGGLEIDDESRVEALCRHLPRYRFGQLNRDQQAATADLADERVRQVAQGLHEPVPHLEHVVEQPVGLDRLEDREADGTAERTAVLAEPCAMGAAALADGRVVFSDGESLRTVGADG